MPRVVHFEIGADDVKRCAKFYEKVFGWKVEAWDGAPGDYMLVETGEPDEDGIDGAIMKRQYDTSVINTVSVDNIDDYINRVKKCGGTILTEKQEVPEIGWFVYAKDTEGNVFGIIEEVYEEED